MCFTEIFAVDADCGRMISVGSAWVIIESPGYLDDGYKEDQMCSWVAKSPSGTRIEAEFVDDFAFLCSTICIDYVELKLHRDQRNTGAR